MMSVAPTEADKLDLRTYEAILWHWNDANSTSSDVEAPDPEVVQPLLDKINSDPRLIH